MTQEDLARELGLSAQTVRSWEAGTTEPRPGHLKRLCEVLSVPPEELLTEEKAS